MLQKHFSRDLFHFNGHAGSGNEQSCNWCHDNCHSFNWKRPAHDTDSNHLDQCRNDVRTSYFSFIPTLFESFVSSYACG